MGFDSQNTYLQLTQPSMLEKQGIYMQKVTSTLNPNISYSQNKTYHVQLHWYQLRSPAYACEEKDRIYTQMKLFMALESNKMTVFPIHKR